MSSPQCPKCNSALAEDYGMVTCPKCGTILFIDMEGIAHLGEAAEPSAQSEVAPDLIHAVTRTGITPQQLNDENIASEELAPLEIPNQDFAAPEFSIPNIEAVDLASPIPLEPFDVPAMSEAPIPDVSTELPPQAEEPMPELNMDDFLGFQEPLADANSLSTEDQVGDPNDPLGLSGYANSELSAAKDGLLLFKILISGIDTKELRESLREALEDSRFGWNIERLMTGIKKGVMTLENVSAVKASILINRIKRLPIQIRWEQNAITQMSEEEFTDPTEE